MSPKKAENPEELTSVLKTWQGLETATIAHTTDIIARTKNPLIRLVMEIIRRDSEMHHRVQQVLLDSLEKEAFTLTPEELGDIWEMVEKARRNGEGHHRTGGEGAQQLSSVCAAAPAHVPDRGREEARSAARPARGLQTQHLPVRVGTSLWDFSRQSKNRSLTPRRRAVLKSARYGRVMCPRPLPAREGVPAAPTFGHG